MSEEIELNTIEDFQEHMIANGKRWFPNAFETPEQQILTNLMGIFGEAGEMADVYKKYLRGSLDSDEATNLLIEESIDLMHYLFQFWYVNDVDFKREYLAKTQFNEERFGEGN